MQYSEALEARSALYREAYETYQNARLDYQLSPSEDSLRAYNQAYRQLRREEEAAQ